MKSLREILNCVIKRVKELVLNSVNIFLFLKIVSNGISDTISIKTNTTLTGLSPPRKDSLYIYHNIEKIKIFTIQGKVNFMFRRKNLKL